MEFRIPGGGNAGLLIAGTKITCDPSTQKLTVDRTKSGEIGFHKAFPGIYTAPLGGPGPTMRLHVFADASSVEVFAENGTRVITALRFPSADPTPIQAFGTDGTEIIDFLLHPLKSIWN